MQEPVAVMNAEQLLKQIRDNRELLEGNNIHALEHFHMLSNNYPHLLNEEININLELSKSYIAFNVDSDFRTAIDISVAVLDKYKYSQHKNLLSRHMRVIGNSYAHLGEFDLAERFFIEAMNSLVAGDEFYRVNKSRLLFSLARMYEFKSGGQEKGIDYLNQALALLTGDLDFSRRANCYMGLGNIYNNMHNLPEALTRYQQACEIFEANYDLGNMASAYCNMGNCYLKMEDFNLAVDYHKKALQLRIKLSSPYELALSYYNFGVVYKAMNELSLAEEMILRALKKVEELGDKTFVAQINAEMDDLERIKRKIKAA